MTDTVQLTDMFHVLYNHSVFQPQNDVNEQLVNNVTGI